MFSLLYQVSGEPAITGCNAVSVRSSCRLDVYLRSVDMCVHLFIDHCCLTVFIRVLNSRGWSQPQNHFNSEIFPVYSIDYLLCLKLS